MIEFKIKLEESFVQGVGRKQIEGYLEEVVIKLSAKDILKDLSTSDLENDKEWQLARNLAWEQEKHRYLA